MNICPSPSTKESQEWQDLEAEVGYTTAIQIFNDAGGKVPTGDNLQAFLDRENSQATKEDNLSYKDDVAEILEKLSNSNVEKLPNQQGYVNTKTGKKVSKRVSMLVEEFYRQQGIHFDGSNKFYALKGTVVHEYLNYLLTNITQDESVSNEDALRKVKQLAELEEFSDVSDGFFDLTNTQFNLLKKLTTELIQDVKDVQKSIDPEGNVSFFTEIPVMDEYSDVAGTIDFLAVFSDGSASMYDFKTFGSNKQQPPGTNKIGAWDVQLSNYRNILKDNYGINHFRHTRAIPIRTQYDKKTNEGWVKQYEDGIQILAVKTKENNLDYLDPIPFNERTGDTDFDKLLDDLNKEIGKINAKISIEANQDKEIKLKQRRRRLLDSLNQLELSKDVDDLLNYLRNTYRVFNKRLHKGKQDPDYLNHGDLVDMIHEIKIYSDLSLNFRNQLNDFSKEKKAKIKQQLKDAEGAMTELASDIKKELMDRLPSDITDPGHIPANDLSKVLLGIGDYNQPIFRELQLAWRQADQMVLDQTFDDIEKIQEYDDAFRDWAKSNGIGQQAKFKLLMNDKKMLHSKYTEEFYKKKKELKTKAYNKELTKEDRKWLAEHFTFDGKQYKKEVLDVFHANIKEDLELGRGGMNQAEYDRRIEIFNKYSNPFTNSKAVYKGTNFKYLKPKEDLDTYINPDWRYIQNNKPLKDYYDMYQEFNDRFAEVTGSSRIHKNFVAHVEQNVTDHIFEHGKRNFREVVSKKFELREHDEYNTRKDSEGNPVLTVPIMHIDPLRTTLSEDRRSKIEKEVEAIYTRGTSEFKNEVAKRVKKKEYEIGLDAKSTDLTSSLILFAKSVNEYQHLNAIEPMIRGLKFVVDTEFAQSKATDSSGKTLVDKLKNGIIKKTGLDPEIAGAFETFANRLIYKQKFESELFNTEKYSSNKVISGLMQWLSIRALGFNVTISAANFVQGKTGLWMMAKEGKYFDKLELKDTISAFGRHDQQFADVMDFFKPATRDLVREQAELSKATGASRRLRTRTYFLGHIKGDDHIDYSLTAAMAKRYRIDSDGKIKNPRSKELINEDAPTVYESVKLGEDGKLYIPGLSVAEKAKFRKMVQRQAFKIKGTMNEEQKGIFASSMLWTMFMQFRNWAIGLGLNRFGEVKYDSTMEELEMGRFNAALGGFFKHGMSSALKETMGLITEISLMGLYKRKPNVERIQYKFDQFIANNTEYKGQITQEQFVQLQKDKLNGFLAEARVYLSIAVMVQLLRGLDWDDEEETNLFTYNSFRITQRALLEVSFWFNPKSVDEIVRSPLPLWGLFREVNKIIDSSVREVSFAVQGERDPRVKTSPYYYILKGTPGINQVLDFAKFFDEYNPPKTSGDYIIEAFSGDEED